MIIAIMSRIIYFYFTNHPVLSILEKSLRQIPDSNRGFPKTENMQVKTAQKNQCGTNNFGVEVMNRKRKKK